MPFIQLAYGSLHGGHVILAQWTAVNGSSARGQGRMSGQAKEGYAAIHMEGCSTGSTTLPGSEREDRSLFHVHFP